MAGRLFLAAGIPVAILVWLSTVLILPGSACRPAFAEVQSGPVRQVTIRAHRDIGYFVGDLVEASIDIVVDDGFAVETASLPHPGPVNYWLDLRTIDVSERSAPAGARRFVLKILYQNFYDALDTRPQEIPGFNVVFRNGASSVSAFVPAWNIEVSSLREVAPPVKEDPKDYLRADHRAPLVATSSLWWSALAATVAAMVGLLVLARDKALWPFHARPARAFGDVAQRLRRMAKQPDDDRRYLEALRLVHRGLDVTAGRRILADDLGAFLRRHPVFSTTSDGLGHFFAASRLAFFADDLERSRSTMPFKALERLVMRLAAAERMTP